MVPRSGDGEVEVAHLPGACREDLESLADVVLSFGGRLYLAHSQLLAVSSRHLASLVALWRETAHEGRDTPLSLLPSSELCTVPDGVSKATSEEFSSFLRRLYRCEQAFEWDTVSGVLQLADYFGVSDVLLQADAWLCEQYAHPAAPLKPPQAAAAFQLASRHRLGGAAALLLPWALQCLARGSRCCAVWHDGRQVCEALRLAFEDSQLKCLALDAYWWSKEAQEGCPRCPCRPADIAGSWDTRLEWAAPIHPGMGVVAGGGASLAPGSVAHARAAQHYAHLLRDAGWANTPPERACSLLATAVAVVGRVQ